MDGSLIIPAGFLPCISLISASFLLGFSWHFAKRKEPEQTNNTFQTTPGKEITHLAENK